MAPRFKYQTIVTNGQSVYKASGSKFHGFAFGIESMDNISNLLEEYRKGYKDVSHCCYAYSFGIEKPITKAEDDGEPNHSAGDPILGQIKSNELDNVIILVFRYFGGTKLGVSGLISAYKSTAKLAITSAEVKSVVRMVKLGLTYEYASTSLINRILDNAQFKIEAQEYSEMCNLQVSIPMEYYENAVDKLYQLRDRGHRVNLKENPISG